MREIRQDNFGLLIAYVLPGFVVLWGVGLFVVPVRGWLGLRPDEPPTVSGFLYVTLASVGAGLLVSTVRWLLVDTLHHWTGIPRRRWDYSRLQEHIVAFEFLVRNQYRYYQAHANSFVAVAFASVALAVSNGGLSIADGVGLAAVETVLWLGSRNNLRNYHERVEKLLGRETEQEDGSKTQSETGRRRPATVG